MVEIYYTLNPPSNVEAINIGGGEAIDEDEDANNAWDDQHLVVETKPSKVEAHLRKKIMFETLSVKMRRRAENVAAIQLHLQGRSHIHRLEIAGAVNQSRTRHKSYTAMLLVAEDQFSQF